MEEIWKDIPGYEGLYQVSTLGKIKSLPKKWIVRNGGTHITKEFIRNGEIGRGGYLYINLCKRSKPKTFLIHRIIAQTFIFNLGNKPCINHKDGNKLNNNVENLEWCTYSENHKHAYKLRLMNREGERHHLHKLTEIQVMEIKKIMKNKNNERGIWAKIAKKFNVHPMTISGIVCGRNWRHI